MSSSVAANHLAHHAAPSPETPQAFRLGQRPALDGMRAFAVLVVMAHHAHIPYFKGGNIGVDIFFVLSGFLITSLLLDEWNRTSDLSYRKFYARRALRLLPALVILLIVVESYALLILRGPRFWEIQKAIAAVLLYVSNWVSILNPGGLGPLSHAWSLSIEEQFYLFWPPVLHFLLRSGLRFRRIVIVIVGLAVIVALHRSLMWTGPTSEWRIYNGLDTRIDEILAGCALAAALAAGWLSARPLRLLVRYTYLPAIGFMVFLVVKSLSPGTMYRVGWPAVELALVVILYRLVGWEQSFLHRVLELPPLVWIGRLSYGLYLWHFPVFEKIGGWKASGRVVIPISFAVTFLVTILSYYFVERPFLRLKSRFKSGQ
jgi:peptidoglycan/LPS O-acetylase OafA/YrhL